MSLFRIEITVLFLLLILSPWAAGGQIAEIIDATGDGTGNILDSTNVAVDRAGNVYVTGSNSNNTFRIAASRTCSTGGTPCTITEIIDSTGDGTGDVDQQTGRYLERAAAAATDAFGNVYVVGQFSDNVFRILNPATCSTGGTPCTIAEIIASNGDGAASLDNPTSIAVDASNNVYVTGASSNNVFRIAASTTCSTSGTPCTITEVMDATGDGVGVSTTPSGVAVDRAGNVFVTHQNSDNVFRIAAPTTCSTGGTPCSITEIMDSDGDGANLFDFGRGVVADSVGNVYASAIGFFEPARLFKIDAPGSCSTSGTPCTITELSERPFPAMGTRPQYSGLAVDGEGSLFAAGGNGDDVLRLTTPTACSTTGTPCTITTVMDATGDGVTALDGPGQTAVYHFDLYVSGSRYSAFRVLDVASPDLLFQDGFESGDTTAWN